MTRLQGLLVRLAPILFLVAVALVVSACAPGTGGGGSGAPTPSHSQAPLHPATPGANPIDLFAWLFTPIFQALFIALVALDRLTGNIILAIVLLTIALRVLVIPLYRRQLTSTRQMQLVQPEVKAIQAKYKGDRVKQNAAVQEFYRQRGMNPAGGCLPIILQFGLLIPMYSVFSQGLTNHDITPMLHPLGLDLQSFFGITCPDQAIFDQYGVIQNACLKASATQFGINWGIAEPWTTGLWLTGPGGVGLSFLAIASSAVQLVASRMTLPAATSGTTDDPNMRVQRQMAYFLPFISLLYGGALPAGLFIYWIVATIIQIIQQYFILGWGGMFPLLGWYPEFARNHTPRFPVKLPEPRPAAPGQSTSAAERVKAVDRDVSVQSTIRPNRSRSGRRGRRR